MKQNLYREWMSRLQMFLAAKPNPRVGAKRTAG